ncbi:MAG TPA: hypothetical protein PK018_12620 [Candidatus Competibacter sp.]|nr:hypothetical protein [Candidatus Competibacteraceae bacterium]HPE72992.1 hypothetical protein [Candidatus Competibacter sp.]HRW64414.1 hypothetical protein [Candidatus Competibacter sp.]
MKERIVAVLGMVSLLTTVGCANFDNLLGHDKNKAETEKAAATRPETAPAPAIADSDTLTMTATVKKVDLKNRMVTLKQKGGQPFTIHVGEEARNLPQVRVGDQVVMKYTEAMAVRISRDTTGGITSRKETLSGDRAALGQKPAGSVRNTVETIANVLAIDRQTRKITFQGPLSTLIVKAPADVDIKRLDVGDQVMLTYVEELAISVEPASSKKSARKK